MSKMKKAVSVFVAGLIAASGMITSSAYTEEGGELPIVFRKGITTEVTFKNGTGQRCEGIIDASVLESRGCASQVASYSVMADGEELLSVTLNDILSDSGRVAASARKMNGYYAVDFTFPGTQREAFLTGLTPENLEETQNALIDSYVYGSELQLENFSFIDTEKTTFSHNDDLLCWAAAASNTLQYAGWLEPAGFGDSDDLLDRFTEDFEDGPFNVLSGYSWFLHGVCKPDRESAKPKKTGSGAYLPEYHYGSLTEAVMLSLEWRDKTLLLQQRLREGCGVGIEVVFPGSGAHAISCWGYINDNSFDEDDSRHYSALIVSDSDSDMQPQQDRRVAPNKLNVLSMVLENDRWVFNTYDNARFKMFTSIIPFGRAKEFLDADPNATKDMINDVDFSPRDMKVSGSVGKLRDKGPLLAGMKPILSFTVDSLSMKSFDGELEYRVTVRNSDGETVADEVHTAEISVNSLESTDLDFEFFHSGLPAGSYTAALELNCGKKIDEAFYLNNSTSASFVVSETDADLYSLGLTASVSAIDGDNTVLASVGYSGYDGTDDKITLLSTGYKTGSKYLGNYFWDDEWSSLDSKGSSQAVGAADSVSKRIKAADVYIFRAVFSVGESAEIIKVYTSPVYPPVYGAEVIEIEGDRTVNLPVGETGLGRKIGFSVKNTSAEEYGNLTGEAYIEIRRTGGGRTETVRVGEAAELNLAPGETSPVLSFDTIPDSVPKEGIFFVSAVLRANAGGCGIDSETYLATVRFREKSSTVVTTSNDISDPYDNDTSLREAIEAYDGSSEITFSDRVTGWQRDCNLKIDEPLVIDKKVVIKAPRNDETDYGQITLSNVGKRFFEVKKQGELYLEGFRLAGASVKGYNDDMVPSNGACILCVGGNVSLNKCLFSSFAAKTYGGAIYCNGGRLKASGCRFGNNRASFGGAVTLNNNAVCDMVNCGFELNSSDKGAVLNNNSELNMVSCSLYRNFKTETYSADGACAVTSYGETRLLNCALADNLPADDGNVTYTPYDVLGPAKLCGCVYTSADAKTEADARCVSGVSRDDVLFYRLNPPAEGNPNFVFEPVSVERSGESAFDLSYLPNPKVLAKGVSVSVSGGYLVYSDGKGTYETEIPAAFDGEQYKTDAVGNAHGFEFGCISDFTQTPEAYGYNMGDVNGDGSVDIMDATLLQQYLAEMAELDPAQLAAAELHHTKNILGADISKNITISNVTEIQNTAAEIKS